MQVKDVMSAPIEWVHFSLPIREVARKMRALKLGCIPVGEDGRLVGIVTDRDITCRLVADGRDADRAHVYDLMTRNVAFCRQDQDVCDAVKIMCTTGFRRLPVLDEQEQVVGLLSVDDLCWKIPDRIFTETMRAIIAAHHGRDEASADSALL